MAANHSTSAFGIGVAEVRNHSIDSRRWSNFAYRPQDVVVASWGKSGTTWIQKIVAELILPRSSGISLPEVSPWVEHRILPLKDMLRKLDSQEHRRLVKTHLPVEALPFSAEAKYIFVARDGREAFWSWHRQHSRMTSTALRWLELFPGRKGPPLPPAQKDPRYAFNEWLDADGYPLWPFFSHVRSWWDIRTLDNVLLIHFRDLKADLAGQASKICEFLNVDLASDVLSERLERCSLASMRSHAHSLIGQSDTVFNGGAEAFFGGSETGAWSDSLSIADVVKYRAMAQQRLGSECAQWLAKGYDEFT